MQLLLSRGIIALHAHCALLFGSSIWGLSSSSYKQQKTRADLLHDMSHPGNTGLRPVSQRSTLLRWCQWSWGYEGCTVALRAHCTSLAQGSPGGRERVVAVHVEVHALCTAFGICGSAIFGQGMSGSSRRPTIKAANNAVTVAGMQTRRCASTALKGDVDPVGARVQQFPSFSSFFCPQLGTHASGCVPKRDSAT